MRIGTAGTTLCDRYLGVRALSESLARDLEAEDQVVQSMPDASPTKWHLAHVSWFFETFLLKPYRAGYRPFDERFDYLFNSYYNAVGAQYDRLRRGLITRPTVREVASYRTRVDEEMQRLIEDEPSSEIAERVELGLQHEQQHQELLLMDVKHLFSANPSFPVYREGDAEPSLGVAPLEMVEHEGGVVEIGHDGDGFAYDNESPRHRQLLQPFRIGSRLVTNDEYLRFIEDRGYARPELWLADGWTEVRERRLTAPLYWYRRESGWSEFTLHGLGPLRPEQPVCHLSFYEADAYARWAGCRLPTEAEWETVARDRPIAGNFLGSGSGSLHPRPTGSEAGSGVAQLFGDLWEWTGSAYRPYPGYRPPAGAIGEYNGKFMCNQMVLRGGACVTPDGHVRATYRNFYYPFQRWAFCGLRLAADG